MSSKVENLFNLTNYRDHPEDKDYRVFFYYNLEQAQYFESQLKIEKIILKPFMKKKQKNQSLYSRYINEILEKP